jgi:uncharacterized protein YktA (UPF0223 family)
MKEYEYPIEYNWSTEEMIEVINLYALVEEAYESGVDAEKFKAQYKKFQKIVGGKSFEKQLDKAFEKVSGYSIYQVFKRAQSEKFVKID